MTRFLALAAAALTALGNPSAFADAQVGVARREAADADATFHFEGVPSPLKSDVGEKGRFTLVDGRIDGNSGGLRVLNDGRLPRSEDEPRSNFFFTPGSNGGRFLLDLGSVTELRQVNTYSWHPGSRAPQVYQLFGSVGQEPDFEREPKRGTAPESCGWKLITTVDTRPKGGDPGGQYGVSISDPRGALGSYRFLLFDIRPTETLDPFGQTFFSEIDVVDATGGEPVAGGLRPIVRSAFAGGAGKYQIVCDTTDAPDLTAWATNQLMPIVLEWYPRIVKALPSDGFEPPVKVGIRFKEMDGVAATAGARIDCAAQWFRDNLEREAKGAVVHELVHVVQQYGDRARKNHSATPNPGWLVEGVADYLRWYKYEPNSRGADISASSLPGVRYNASYRPTANFLNWVSTTHDPEIVRKLNAAMREGRYSPNLWSESTGKTVQALEVEWKTALAKELGVPLDGVIGAKNN